MTAQEAREVHRRYARLDISEDDNETILNCYMQGVNRDGHVWVTWTDVEKMICDLMEGE